VVWRQQRPSGGLDVVDEGPIGLDNLILQGKEARTDLSDGIREVEKSSH